MHHSYPTHEQKEELVKKADLTMADVCQPFVPFLTLDQRIDLQINEKHLGWIPRVSQDGIG